VRRRGEGAGKTKRGRSTNGEARRCRITGESDGGAAEIVEVTVGNRGEKEKDDGRGSTTIGGKMGAGQRRSRRRERSFFLFPIARRWGTGRRASQPRAHRSKPHKQKAGGGAMAPAGAGQARGARGRRGGDGEESVRGERMQRPNKFIQIQIKISLDKVQKCILDNFLYQYNNKREEIDYIISILNSFAEYFHMKNEALSKYDDHDSIE
jgi:hypothetical protein